MYGDNMKIMFRQSIRKQAAENAMQGHYFQHSEIQMARISKHLVKAYQHTTYF
jgi:hypothetical protein